MEVDLSNLSLNLRQKMDEVLRTDFNVTVMKAMERQRQIAARNYLHRPRARDGFGELTQQIDPVFDAMWRIHYGWDYSHNKDLLRFLMRRNPEIRVQSRGTKIQVGYAPGSNSRRPVGLTTN